MNIGCRNLSTEQKEKQPRSSSTIKLERKKDRALAVTASLAKVKKTSSVTLGKTTINWSSVSYQAPEEPECPHPLYKKLAALGQHCYSEHNNLCRFCRSTCPLALISVRGCATCCITRRGARISNLLGPVRGHRQPNGGWKLLGTVVNRQYIQQRRKGEGR